jgi:hypothetical protein
MSKIFQLRSELAPACPLKMQKRGRYWEPWASIWWGLCGLAAFCQGQNLQVYPVSITVGRNFLVKFSLTKKKFILSQGHW